jgi:ParB-like nuclease domain
MALRLDPQNPRLHSRKQVLQIANSIASFGFNVPVLIDAEQSVIAGHGRVLAAKQLGWTEVPVIAIEHLDAAQRRAFAIGLEEWQHDNVPTSKSSLRRARRRIRTTKRTIASSQRPSENRFSVTRLAYAQSP